MSAGGVADELVSRIRLVGVAGIQHEIHLLGQRCPEPERHAVRKQGRTHRGRGRDVRLRHCHEIPLARGRAALTLIVPTEAGGRKSRGRPAGTDCLRRGDSKSHHPDDLANKSGSSGLRQRARGPPSSQASGGTPPARRASRCPARPEADERRRGRPVRARTEGLRPAWRAHPWWSRRPRFCLRIEPAGLFAHGSQEGVQRGSGRALSSDDDKPSADDGLRNVADGQGRVDWRKCEGGHQGDGSGHHASLTPPRVATCDHAWWRRPSGARCHSVLGAFLVRCVHRRERRERAALQRCRHDGRGAR